MVEPDSREGMAMEAVREPWGDADYSAVHGFDALRRAEFTRFDALVANPSHQSTVQKTACRSETPQIVEFL